MAGPIFSNKRRYRLNVFTGRLDLTDISQIEFLNLLDTPSDYTGHAGEALVVNVTEDGLIFSAAAGGGHSIYIEENDAAVADNTVADLTLDFLGSDFNLALVGNEVNISIAADYSAISANDAATDVTGAELETLTDGSNADLLHTHAGGTDVKVAVDAAATADYIGAANNDGVLRTGSPITYADGGDFVTLGIDETAIDHDNLLNFVADEHIAHSGISIIAGTLLTGGGTIDGNVTLNVDEASIDHGNLAGLGDDDHAAYPLVTNFEVDRATIATNWTDLTDGGDTTLHGHDVTSLTNWPTIDYSYVSGNDAATDVTALELEELTDGSLTILHDHDVTGLTNWPTIDYSYVSGIDATTDITAAQLETLSDGSNADTLHDHTVAGITDIASNYLKLDASNDPVTGALAVENSVQTYAMTIDQQGGAGTGLGFLGLGITMATNNTNAGIALVNSDTDTAFEARANGDVFILDTMSSENIAVTEVSELGTAWNTLDGKCVSIGRMGHAGWTSTELIATAENFDYLEAGDIALGLHIIVDQESSTTPLYFSAGQFDCYLSEDVTTARGLGGNIITEESVTVNRLEGVTGQLNITAGGTITEGICVWAELDIDAAFSGGDIYGFKFNWDDFSSGSGDNFYAIYADGTPDTGSGNFTNSYGLYLAAMDCATNTYGVYQAATADQNHFAGPVEILEDLRVETDNYSYALWSDWSADKIWMFTNAHVSGVTGSAFESYVDAGTVTSAYVHTFNVDGDLSGAALTDEFSALVANGSYSVDVNSSGVGYGLVGNAQCSEEQTGSGTVVVAGVFGNVFVRGGWDTAIGIVGSCSTIGTDVAAVGDMISIYGEEPRHLAGSTTPVTNAYTCYLSEPTIGTTKNLSLQADGDCVFGSDVDVTGTMGAGTVTGINVTSGADPGHTHTAYSAATHASEHEVGGSDLVSHDSLTGFVSNEHINHTSVIISGTNGVTGGGAINASRTLQLNFNGLSLGTPSDPTADVIAYYDVGDKAHEKITIEDFAGVINTYLPDKPISVFTRTTSNQTGFNRTSSVNVEWNNEEVDDSDITDHDNSTDPDEIEIQLDGWYLVTANAYFERVGTGDRASADMWMAIDGTEVPGTRATGYTRNQSGLNPGNAWESSTISTHVYLESGEIVTFPVILSYCDAAGNQVELVADRARCSFQLVN